MQEANRRIFETALERVRYGYGLRVYGYVVMPDHVHLLLSETSRQTLADALKSLKQGVSRRLIGGSGHFWQKRYSDFNILTAAKFTQKLRYVYRNPVRAGLYSLPGDWEWSSFSHYATGCEGRVEIESKWTAQKRERAEADQFHSSQSPPSSHNQA